MVKHIFDRFFSFSEPPEIRTVEGFSAVFAFVRCEHRLCSQTTRASLRNIVAALCPTEGQTPQKPFKFTRDILPFLARFVNLDEDVIGGKKIRACIFRNLTSGR